MLFDTKADILVYGLAERTVVDLGHHLRDHTGYHDLSGSVTFPKNRSRLPRTAFFRHRAEGIKKPL